MVKETISLSDVCNLLNDILNDDYECVRNLINHRVRCNKKIANHPTIQVRKYKKDKEYTLGLLGILNGLFGIREDGMGALCMEIDDNDKILTFKPTPPEPENDWKR